MKRSFWILLVPFLCVALYAQTRLTINVGNTSNDGTGDSVRSAFQKANTNFATLWATVYTNGGGAGTGTSFATLESLAALVSYTSTAAFEHAYVSGGNGGFFLWNAASTTATNALNVIANPWNAGTGRWIRQPGMGGQIDVGSGDLVFDGGANDYDFTVQDMASTSIEGNNASFTGLTTLSLDGQRTLELFARTNFYLWTPEVWAQTQTNGHVLTLIDATTGETEFAPITATPDATKLPLAGGTMSGAIAMGSQKITGLASGTAANEAIHYTQLNERIAFDSSRNNILLNNGDNAIVDTDAGTKDVTLLGAGGSLPNRIGTSAHIIAGNIASGVIMARRVYYVSGTTGTVTYNAVAYAPGNTFTGVYGTKTYSATGDCVVKDNITRQTDTYSAGTAYVASILGGYDHLNNQIAGTIAGGGHNVLLAGGAGNHATIVGGSYNTQQSGVYAFIGGGTQNENRVDFGFIGGGWGNWITDDNWSAADQGTIVNGQEGQIQDTAYGFIGTGLNNRVINPFSSTSVYNNQIINGQANIVQSLAAGINYSTVLNGTGNIVSGGSHNTAWGLNNNIYGNSGGYGVAIGNTVVIDGTGTYGFGYGATITQTNSPRAVVMGASTTITDTSDSWTFANNSTVTSANYAFTAGNSHTLNGTQYTFLLGRSLSSADLTSPSANADYGMAQGYQAVIRSYGQRVESNGNESSVNVQRSRYILKRRAAHTTGTDLQLRLDGSTEFPYVPTNSVWTCRALITAAQSDGVKYGSWSLDFAVRDSGGTLSLLGSPASVTIYDGHSTTWTIAAAIRSDATYRGIILNARALTGETVTWGASLDAMELNGAW